MKRDMDLIRLLLIQAETGEEPEELAKQDQQFLAYQIALMIDANLVEGRVIKNRTGGVHGAILTRLTWAGHDFLDAARNESNWKSVRDKIITAGGAWTFPILLELLKAEAKRHLGLT